MKSLLTRHRFLRVLAMAVAVGAMGLSANAMADTGGLHVTVLNQQGEPIDQATVQATSPTSLVERTGETNASGEVILRGLIPGTNYTLHINAQGYTPANPHNVAVVSNKTLDLTYRLGKPASQLGTVVVTGQSLAAIDTTSTSTGTVLTLDTVQALPTGRSYQSYLQLVPAVKPSQSGNPAVRSGVNYSMIGGATGVSTDNVYIVDGINVTDAFSGTFGSHLNSEVIRQQVVLTGGIPAKYPGGTGLVTKVITKSGSNEFHGSVYYSFQNSSMVADYKHEQHADFSQYETAFTLGGPIIKDTLWFFISYEKKHKEVNVLRASTRELMRTVQTDKNLGFAKLTYQISPNDRLQVSFFNDPTDISGQDTASIPNSANYSNHLGGSNYRATYTHQWANFKLSLYYYKHKREIKQTPIHKIVESNVAYVAGNPTPADIQRGENYFSDEWHNSEEYGIKGEWWVYTDWGTHDIEFGVSYKHNIYKNSVHLYGGHWFGAVSQDAYDIIGGTTPGATLRQIVSAEYIGPAPTDPNPAQLFLSTGLLQQYPFMLTWFDNDNDGDLLKPKRYKKGPHAGDIVMSNGKPVLIPGDGLTGAIVGKKGPKGAMVIRRQVVIPQPYNLGSKGKVAYLQDSWTYGQWTANVGIRAEEWTHYDSTGHKFYTFEWTFAPRLSVAYDLSGNGTSKISFFYGRYYDPIRNNMTDFGGSITSNILKSQVFFRNPTTSNPKDGRWVTYRQRGGPGHRDATFVPNTKTPYTDEYKLAYATTLGANMSFSIVLDHRVTKNLLEDYNMDLYAGLSGYLHIPYTYFGYSGKADKPAGVNYYIGTLKDGVRKYSGVTISLTKFRANNWMAKVSYTYNHSEGNSMSDSNADYQGDIYVLDPRAINRYGLLPGSIRHMLQAYGSYFFDFGLTVGAVLQVNSGIRYSKTELSAGRHLPVTGTDYRTIRGTTPRLKGWGWIQPGTVGGYVGPAFFTLDLRLKYNWDLSFGKLHFFMDIFNVLNRQQPRMVQDLAKGNAQYPYFQQPTDWTSPRSLRLGVRYTF